MVEKALRVIGKRGQLVFSASFFSFLLAIASLTSVLGGAFFFAGQVQKSQELLALNGDRIKSLEDSIVEVKVSIAGGVSDRYTGTMAREDRREMLESIRSFGDIVSSNRSRLTDVENRIFRLEGHDCGPME